MEVRCSQRLGNRSPGRTVAGKDPGDRRMGRQGVVHRARGRDRDLLRMGDGRRAVYPLAVDLVGDLLRREDARIAVVRMAEDSHIEDGHRQDAHRARIPRRDPGRRGSHGGVDRSRRTYPGKK